MWVRQSRSMRLVGLALMGLVASQGSSALCADAVGTAKPAESRKTSSSGDQPKQIEEVARRIFAITDVVLEHHIEPATRQEMILAGLRSACAAKKISMPDLGRRVSDLRTRDELTGLLNELWPRFVKGGNPSSDEVQRALFVGLLRPLPGSPYILPAKEARVQAQIQANRYVGIGIALSIDEKSKVPQIKHTQPGGPAQLGGVRAGDLIEEINAVRVAPGARLAEVVDQLRGAEGTELAIQVRQPDAKQARTLHLMRLPVMFKSVKSSQKESEEDRVVIASSQPTIAYLRIDPISASTARELASWEPRLREAGVRGLILDLRAAGGKEGFEGYHSAVLLADRLLDGKPIGKLRSTNGVREFVADRDCLFRELPLAILVDQNTNGPAAWVAAALQDADPRKQEKRRAVIVGTPSGDDNFVRSAWPLPSGDESLILPTAVWERPNAAPSSDEEVAKNDGFHWRVSPDANDVAIIALQPPATVAVAKLKGKSTYQIVGPSPQQTPVTASTPAPLNGTALTSSPQDLDQRYKEAAVAELRRQIELREKPSQ